MSFGKVMKGIVIFGILIIIRMFYNARKRKISRHLFTIAKRNSNSKKMNVFFISDIHRRKIDQLLLNKIDAQVDLVLIGGDLAEQGVPLERIAKNIERLSSLGPTYFVWGNNDREADEHKIRKIFQEHKVRLLENENVFIPNHPLWGVCGTDDPSSGKVNLEHTLKNIEQYKNVILVTHQPQVIYKMEKRYKPTLSLAGHTHGGQIRMGYLGLLEKGTFKQNGHFARLISNGYGTSTVPLRLGADPECHLITIEYDE